MKAWKVILGVAAVLLVVAGGLGIPTSVSAQGNLMVIYGDTQSTGASFPLPTGTLVSCTNTRTGETAVGAVGAIQRGYYEAVFFSTEGAVAEVGDLITISVEDASFFAPNGQHVLTGDDLTLGSVRIDVAPDAMSPAPLPGPVSAITGCFPNPFNPRTTIVFGIETAGQVGLEVQDLRGRRVAVLRDRFHEAGEYRETWNGLTGAGAAVPSGIYLAVLRTAAGVSVQKLVLAR